MVRHLATVLLLVGLVAAPSGAKPGKKAPVDVARAVLEVLEEIRVEAKDVRVDDLRFWKEMAPKLEASGKAVPGLDVPKEKDVFRSPLIDRMLRTPMEAVRLGPALLARKAPAPLADLSRVRVGRKVDRRAPEPPPDAVLPDADLAEGLQRLAAVLVRLETLADTLPVRDEDARLLGWMVEGIDVGDVVAARRSFERYRAVDLDALRRGVLQILAELPRGGKAVWPKDEVLRLSTTRGVVLIGTRKADVFDEDAWLAIDPGGDDIWRNNAGGTGTGRRVALAIDLGGDDVYESDAPYVQGAALGGIGILIDWKGDDTYRGATGCQGAAVGGVGVLADLGGEDEYDAKAFAQGAAAFGMGLLLDRGGQDDTYAIDRIGQGLGRTAGLGALLDAGGNDRYEARPTHESVYTEWTKGRTVHWSFAQGCGLGFYGRYETARSDGTTGLVIHDLHPGGIGLLFDTAGDDVYRGSMYAQGTGYFYGLGVLCDAKGNDDYEASWYGQGAAPHFAVGVLVDGKGNDRYRGMHQVQGNGRDFAVGVCLDLQGDDRYEGEDRVQGCGDHRHGWGFFVDAKGKDHYVAKRRSARGWATLEEPKDGYADYGVFLDLAGKDVYEGKAEGENDATWIQIETVRGIGRDR